MKVLCFFIILISLAPLFSQQSPALAVMYLETNASQGSTSVISQDDKDALALAVREMILADLSSMDFLILVEREELERILEEQRLGLSGLLDQETASEAGELLGARYLLTGSLIFTGQAVSLNLKISDTQSGRVESSISKTAHLEQSFILQEEVLEELILRWGLELSQEDRRRLSLRDNPSLQGLIHLGNALDAQNKGDYQKALTYLQAAVELDPDFGLANYLIRQIELRFQEHLTSRDEDLPLEILERIDALEPGQNQQEQQLMQMYWSFIQPISMGLAYYGSWAAMDENTKDWFFEESIKTSWNQMGLREEPQSMEEVELYLGSKLYNAYGIIEYLLEKDLPKEGFNPYMHPVEGMVGYFLTLFASISSNPDWQFPRMVNPQGEVMVTTEQYYPILLRYCDMFINNFPYSSYSAMVTPMMPILLNKVED